MIFDFQSALSPTSISMCRELSSRSFVLLCVLCHMRGWSKSWQERFKSSSRFAVLFASPLLLTLKDEVTLHYHARSMSSCCVMPEIGGGESTATGSVVPLCNLAVRAKAWAPCICRSRCCAALLLKTSDACRVQCGMRDRWGMRGQPGNWYVAAILCVTIERISTIK